MTAQIFNFFVTLKGNCRLSGCQLFSYTSERLGAEMLLESCVPTSICCRSNNNNCIECREPQSIQLEWASLPFKLTTYFERYLHLEA